MYLHLTFWETLLCDVTDIGNIFLNAFSDEGSPLP